MNDSYRVIGPEYSYTCFQPPLMLCLKKPSLCLAKMEVGIKTMKQFLLLYENIFLQVVFVPL